MIVYNVNTKKGKICILLMGLISYPPLPIKVLIVPQKTIY